MGFEAIGKTIARKSPQLVFAQKIDEIQKIIGKSARVVSIKNKTATVYVQSLARATDFRLKIFSFKKKINRRFPGQVSHFKIIVKPDA